jgi:hypothetical protein
MPDPTEKQQAEESEVYVSPTSDETVEERYARITASEADMTEAELEEKIARLEMPSDLFDWEGNE